MQLKCSSPITFFYLIYEDESLANIVKTRGPSGPEIAHLDSQQAKNIGPTLALKGIYMGPTWATHKGLMRDLQQGSILDPHGQIHVELYGSSMGKINPHLSSRKTIFTHFYINDYKSLVPAHLMDW